MLSLIERPGFLLVVLIGILIFGAKRLPESARALGRSMRILKAETKGLTDSDETTPVATNVTPVPAVTSSIAPPTPLHAEPAPEAQPAPNRTAV